MDLHDSASTVRPSRHAVLLTFGSSGDVNPFLGLGDELLGRGWDVTLVTNARYEAIARHHNLDFAGIGTDEDFDAFVKNPDAWHPSKGTRLVFGAMADYARETYTVVRDLLRPGTVIVAGTLGVAGRVLHETHDVPLVTMHLSPTVFRSHLDPPLLPGVPPMHRVPEAIRPWVMKHFWNGADRYVLDKSLAGLAAFRGELGLDPVTGYLGDWLHSPMRTLAMWPDWFAPAPADYPEQSRLCGFPLYDERKTAEMPAEVEAFLTAGAPPIVFTPGSAMAHGDRFFTAAAEACRRLNVRGLLVSRFEHHLPTSLPPGVKAVAFAPFAELLPRCRAIVHHGGIGTLSQALAAGVPQLIMPMAHDQPDNARRLRGHGVAESLSPRRFTGRRVARALSRLLTEGVAERCRELAKRIDRGAGLRCACDEIDEIAEKIAIVPSPEATG